MNEKYKTIPWLCILFYIQIAGLILTALGRLLPVLNISLGGSWITWAQRAINLATVACLFLLPMCYRKAAICRAAWLICSLLVIPLLRLPGIQVNLTVNSVLSLVASALSLFSLYLEYAAHSAVTAPRDSNKWPILFFCGLAVSLAASAATAIAQPWLVDMSQSGNFMVINIYNFGIWLPNLAVSITYLVLLYRTIQHAKNEEISDG